ncbi:MAG: phospholipid/cholesterol/gamma-HCH transport system substrate-binding protein [Thermoleophilaceae bacterium]|nr:phospholipid/cholesterol/gamma-HCH transport system substrate-binding protein [Thermoleophilaceae bacterium]
MIKQAPSVGRILTMVAFSLSCFGIVLFLWLSFGGSVPLRPQGYEVKVAFPEATQLAQSAEVRISGVKVGRVRSVQPNQKSGLTDTVLEIDSRYAPIPRSTRAILRQKTLLGETYVEITPGSPGGPKLKDGGMLPKGQVAETVELDEILRTFDPETRRQFSVWLDQQGLAVGNNAEAINDALGLLTPFAEQTDEVLKVLNTQSAETRALVRDTGEVFDALTERQGQLRELIVNSNRVWEVTARRDAELADTFRVLPTFLREGRTTTRRLTQFAQDTNPLINQLRPAARQLSPTLQDLDAVAPDLRGLFKDLDPLVRVSRRGLPATTQVLDNTRPLLRRLDPFLRNFTPIVDYLGLYRREIAALFANDTAVTQAADSGQSRSGQIHYLRTQNPENPEVMAGYPSRIATNRSNPYIAPGGYLKLKTEGHLEVFGTQGCGTTPVPPTPAPLDPWLPAGVVAQIDYYTFGDTQNRNAAPPCDPQTPLGQLVGQSGSYPHLAPLP